MAKALPHRPVEVDPFSHDANAAAVERLTALIEAQARVIRRYEETLAHSRRIFEEATAAARLGLWECDLTTETLQWSNGTYDLFDLPRGMPLLRQHILPYYPEHSLKLLERVRSQAIRQRRSFNLDAEIVTPKGSRRWLRIHATVDCAGDRPIRIFGLKQDITEDKERWERARYRAECDDMTGLANRSRFQERLAEFCGDDGRRHSAGVLLLIDLDGFKEVNDSLGHRAGDECLKEVARRIKDACPTAFGTSLVARIGGDEFAVLVEAGLGPAMELAGKTIEAVGHAMTFGRQTFRIGASIGLAAIDGSPSRVLFDRADRALYAAKAGGRNTFRVFHTPQP